MNHINPQIVGTPDGRVGVLVARVGMNACVSFTGQRTLSTYRLDILDYHFAPWGARARKHNRPDT